MEAAHFRQRAGAELGYILGRSSPHGVNTGTTATTTEGINPETRQDQPFDNSDAVRADKRRFTFSAEHGYTSPAADAIVLLPPTQ